MRGAIVSAGSGAIAGYGGGVGSRNSILRSAYQGALIGGVGGGAIGFGEWYFQGKPGIESMLGSEVRENIRGGIWDGVKHAAEKGDFGALPFEIAKSVGKTLYRQPSAA